MKAEAEGLLLFDLHCHLDFAPDAVAAAAELDARGVGALSVTVTPQDYEHAEALLADCGNVRVGAGLHPWWIADGRCGEEDVARFEQLAKRTRFIGEIGLDFAGDRASSREAQMSAFERAVAVCASEGGKVLSLHAVRAAGDVLDVLERTGALASNACVFHWFSGTSDELHRVMRAGCFCSINPRMLGTKRGRAYASAMPVDRLLLETDTPSELGAPYDAVEQVERLEALIDDLAELRRTSRDDLAAHIAQTSRNLLFS